MAWNQIDYFIFRNNQRALRLARAVSYLVSVLAFGLLIYRYGYLLTDPERLRVLLWMEVVFGTYAFLFGVRLLFDYDRLAFLRREWFEALLIGLVMLRLLNNTLSDNKLVLYFFRLLSFSQPELAYEHFWTFYLLVLVLLEVARASTLLPDLKIKPGVSFILSFVILILGGAGLLMLPAMTVNGQGMPPLNALFTSASASCVTGLALEDTGLYFTIKGHLVILLLIQLGGLGIVLFATFFASFLSAGVGLKHQSLMQDHLSSESLASAKELLRKVVFITVIIESVGAVLIYYSFDDSLWKFNGEGEKIFYAIFHSISGFCNAGFSLFPGGYYHEAIRQMYWLHLVTGFSIVFGGIGFTVIEDIFSPVNIRERMRKPWKNWQLGTKLPLYTSLILILVGTVAFMVLEFDQLTDRTIIEAFITAFFQSVVTRTAGFNTMDFSLLAVPTLILTIFFMFIGAVSGSTGGGIKVNTFVLILLASIRNIKGAKIIIIQQRYISNDLVNKAFTLLLFAFTYNSLAIFLLSITEAKEGARLDLLPIVFEQISAFATVGLSMNLTSTLTDPGKIIIIITMFVGRVGPLTLAVALSSAVKTNALKYPRAYLMIG
jgi:potassium uptake TrkH family protein